jgi:hypothetical protein
MVRVSRTQVLICVLALGIGLVAATDVSAQVASILQPGTITGIVQINQNVAQLTDVNVFTVPAGQTLRITDVIISNPSGSLGAGACCQRIFVGAGCITQKTAFINVPGPLHGSFEHSFLTGINFVAGQVVCLRNGDGSAATSWTVRGFLFHP